MFSENDFENIENLEEKVPDGLLDASDFYNDMVFVTKLLEEFKETDYVYRVNCMMKSINYLYKDDGSTLDGDKIYGLVVSMLFHLHTLLEGMYDEDRVEYFRTINEDVFPNLSQDVKSLPYWEEGNDK